MSNRPHKTRNSSRHTLGLALALGAASPAAWAQTPTDNQNAALLAFKREQVALLETELAARGGYAPRELTDAITQTRNRATEIETSVGDAANTRFNLHERAYFAPDGSAQPFWVALPNNYTPRRKWPLIVYLHGYSTDISKINPWFPPAEMLDAARQRGFLMAIPYGRRNSDFVQWGEDDTLRVKTETMAHYSIDSARVFLAGASMGGYGAYAIGLHDPGQWAAVAPICGRTDFYLWFNLKRDAVPAWKRALYDADDPRFLARNASSTPFFTQHGSLDMTVPVEHSRRFAADAKALKLPFFYREQSDGDHWFDFQGKAVEWAFNWFQMLPSKTPPKQIDMVAVDLREARNSWARIEAFEKYGEAARLKVQLSLESITVEAQNVTRFVLEPPSGLLRPGRLVTLMVNGVESSKLYDPLLPIAWEKTGAAVEKSPQHCGPFKNAFRDPFLLVYGDENDQKAAQHFAREWSDNADGNAPLKAATEIADADKKSFNLILFGTRDSNPLLAEIADNLPLELTAKGYRRGDKNVDVAEREKLGLRLVWKSPWSKERLVAVCSGLWWGEKLPVNHKLDLIPDYLLYNDKTDADDTNHPLEAGFFDGNWKLEETDKQ